ncbi:nucleoside diphosphate kinase regulator [Dokdonella sp. MW10]|uniref:nucleoside diphosphate kinase regulator n=1 Tax=Dokdonella sp. MW10 TaxID=2992926 RepID=UPI003F7FF8A9
MKPAIRVSSLDLERLESLLDEPAHARSATAEALRGELARATILEPAGMPADVVTMNSTARVRDRLSGDDREVTLVYPRDADAAAGRVSIMAPLGSAMLGLRVGDTIHWNVPGGRPLHVEVTGLAYQPEASGHLHR